MKKIVLNKTNGYKVPAFLEVPEDASGIVIAVHGLTSSKECSTYKTLFRIFPESGLGVLGIDLPGHGTEEAYEEPLRTDNCIGSIEAAEKYAVSLCPDCDIYYFGSSFGAYLTMLYLSRRDHKGRKAFFRSAAVNMSTLFIKEDPSEEEKKQMKDLMEKGFFEVKMDNNRPVVITRALYDELADTDLFNVFEKDRYGRHDIAMAHGCDDAVIDPEKAKLFAEKFSIPITFFKDEGHSLASHPDTPDKVARLAVKLYKGKDRN